MPVTQVMFNAVIKRLLLHGHPIHPILLYCCKVKQEPYRICSFSFPLWVLQMLIKNIRLVIKRMQGGRRESQGTPPRKVKMFTLLLRNGVNQANVDRGETKRENKSHGTCPIRWMVIKNGLSKMRIDGVRR